MSSLVFSATALLAASPVAALDVAHAAAHLRPLGGASLASIPVHSYRQDCFQRRPLSSGRRASRGAAFLQSLEEPVFDEGAPEVLKDGFFFVDCVKDFMYYHADKVGKNKFSYEAEAVANTSILLYGETIPKEDAKAMTVETCFEFCRTVPDMLFFGLTSGRTCYCAPYYKPVAGDSSSCDAVCDGNPTTMCGGKTKSSIYEMHACMDTGGQLSLSLEKVSSAEEALAPMLKVAGGASAQMQKVGAKLQESFGAVGDEAVGGFMQKAKAFAGELEHAVEDAEAASSEVTELKKKAEGLSEGGFEDVTTVREAEELMSKMETSLAKVEEKTEGLGALLELAVPSLEGVNATQAGLQYYPVMYFVDKEFEEVPSTCGGDMTKSPIVNKTFGECAAACDAAASCVGFNFFKEKLCFLLSTLTAVTYYTGCGDAALLQGKQASRQAVSEKSTMCVAKFADLVGTTLKPDPSGKCDKCLKEATKADRCFK